MTVKLYAPLLLLQTFFRQLWLSVSSINFYCDVYKFYSGYGLRYLLMTCFLSSLIYCLSVLTTLVELKNYFVSNQSSKSTTTLEYIINQLPDIYYDGSNITLKDFSPLYLYKNSRDKVAVIDCQDQLTHAEKMQVPIILTSNKIIVSFTENARKKKFTVPLSYVKIFGTSQQIITQDWIRQQGAALFNQAPTALIYIIMPVSIISIFVFTVLENSFVIMLVYLLIYIFGPRASLKTCTRLISFASSIPVLMQSIVVVLAPEFIDIIWPIKMWTGLLLFLAVLRVKKEKVSWL